ncbi:hypothetical protein [Actinoallomurus iriomotensis]|uniref:hypothetical protein n=1 Tax=Actinoallomurus iriomotensis TaxID=478107 RepID=UPI002555808B|nr:hypothetical protein [Actinoallomurus iriomotensis]
MEGTAADERAAGGSPASALDPGNGPLALVKALRLGGAPTTLPVLAAKSRKRGAPEGSAADESPTAGGSPASAFDPGNGPLALVGALRPGGGPAPLPVLAAKPGKRGAPEGSAADESPVAGGSPASAFDPGNGPLALVSALRPDGGPTPLPALAAKPRERGAPEASAGEGSAADEPVAGGSPASALDPDNGPLALVGALRLGGGPTPLSVLAADLGVGSTSSVAAGQPDIAHVSVRAIYPLCVYVSVLNLVTVRAELGDCGPAPSPPVPPPTPPPPPTQPAPPPSPAPPPPTAPLPPGGTSPAPVAPVVAPAVPAPPTRTPPAAHRPSAPVTAQHHRASGPKAAPAPPRHKNPLTTLMVLVVITAVIAAGAGVAFAAAP